MSTGQVRITEGAFGELALPELGSFELRPEELAVDELTVFEAAAIQVRSVEDGVRDDTVTEDEGPQDSAAKVQVVQIAMLDRALWPYIRHNGNGAVQLTDVETAFWWMTTDIPLTAQTALQILSPEEVYDPANRLYKYNDCSNDDKHGNNRSKDTLWSANEIRERIHGLVPQKIVEGRDTSVDE